MMVTTNTAIPQLSRSLMKTSDRTLMAVGPSGISPVEGFDPVVVVVHTEGLLYRPG